MRIYVLSLKNFLKSARIVSLIMLIVFCAVLMFDTVKKADTLFEMASAEPNQAKPVIIIDAGHGGEDSGAVGVNGISEKDLNLSVAILIGEEFKSKGYNVVYTRTEDKLVIKPEEDIRGLRKISDLKNRCALSQAYENAIFVSIHMNSFGSAKYSGLQVYYTDDNDESYRLASSVQANVKETLQNQNNRVVKNGKSIYVLENCKNTGILIECGFITNEDECKKLSEKEYQKQLSFSIVCGIINYIEAKKS